MRTLRIRIFTKFVYRRKKQRFWFLKVSFLAQKEGFVSPHSTLVGPLGSKAALRPYSPPRGSNPSAPPNFLCKNKRDSDSSKSLSGLIPPRLIQYEKTEAGFALITGSKLYRRSFRFCFPAQAIQDGLTPWYAASESFSTSFCLIPVLGTNEGERISPLLTISRFLSLLTFSHPFSLTF